MGAIIAGTNIRLVSVFVETRPYGAKNTDDYGIQICSLLVFDRSAEQIGDFTDLPQYHWHRLFAIYYLSYLFSNRNQSRGQIRDLSTR